MMSIVRWTQVRIRGRAARPGVVGSHHARRCARGDDDLTEDRERRGFRRRPDTPLSGTQHQIRRLRRGTANRDRVPDGIRSALPRTPAWWPLQCMETVPGQRLSDAHDAGAVPDGDDIHLREPSDEGTRMTTRNRGEPSGFARVAIPVMDRAIRRATSKDLARLKSILESAEGPVT